jgi:hypothetical protein
VATSVLRRRPSAGARAETLVVPVYGLGAVALAGEAVVHVQQYFSLYHGVRWIGVLFLLNALGCVAVIAGLAVLLSAALAAAAAVRGRRLPR